MAAIIRPSRTVSFSKSPRGPIPLDQLDAQIQNLIDAIHSTQEALSDIRRDDGQLKSPPPSRPSAELQQMEARILAAGSAIAATAAGVQSAARDIDLRAKDAETAAFAAENRSVSASTFQATAFDALSDAENSADRSEYAADPIGKFGAIFAGPGRQRDCRPRMKRRNGRNTSPARW